MIYLTGATGFLGKSIYSASKEEFHCYYRDEPLQLEEVKPDLIIHCAGEIYDTKQMFESNIVLTNKILEYCAKSKCPIIYIGSSSEYGKLKTSMSEEVTPEPETVYAATKLCGTALCQGYSRQFDFDCAIVRPFSVYGPLEPKHRLIPTLFDAASYGYEVSLIKGNHDFIYINDFLYLLNKLTAKLKGKRGNIFNFGTGIQTTNLGVLKLVEKVTKKKINYTLKNEWKKQDSKIWKSDTYLTNTVLGKPLYSLKDGLKEMYYEIYRH